MERGQDKMAHKGMMSMSWGMFAATIAISIVIMFFLMYQLIYSLDHFFFSTNRLVAALIMGATMTAVMLGFMWSMFRGTGVKTAVLVGAIIVAFALLAINRSQTLNGDVRFMKAMIPHHSIAINNARKADISDPRVRRLANEIIESQVREIAEMKILIESIDERGELGDDVLPRRPAIVTPEMRAKIEQNIESATPQVK